MVRYGLGEITDMVSLETEQRQAVDRQELRLEAEQLGVLFALPNVLWVPLKQTEVFGYGDKIVAINLETDHHQIAVLQSLWPLHLELLGGNL